MVKRIFAMTIEGYGPYQIASKRKEDKVLIPSAYLARHGEGVNKNKTFKDVYGWGSLKGDYPLYLKFNGTGKATLTQIAFI